MNTKASGLTLAELKSLILAHFKAEQSRLAKLQARLQQECGYEIQEEKPEAIAFKDKFMDWVSDIIARRLKRNRRTTPLLSSRDILQFISAMIDQIVKTEGSSLEAEEHKMFEKFMKMTAKNLFEAVDAMVPPGQDPYDEYWRWITIVLDLAVERGIPSAELFALEDATDEITRRMFTKKQFVALSKRAMNKFVDADVLKKIIVQPMLDMVADEADEEERRELEQELETELMPQLRETVEKTKVVFSTLLEENVARIYGTT